MINLVTQIQYSTPLHWWLALAVFVVIIFTVIVAVVKWISNKEYRKELKAKRQLKKLRKSKQKRL